MAQEHVHRLLERQNGLIARRQVLACGLTDNDIERLVGRRQSAVVHRGVYVVHTGPLSWVERVWAATLADACQQGLPTPSRLLATLRSRRRLRQWQLLLDVLDDLDGGVRSVMEQRYLRTVERPHSLPSGRRQRRVVTPRGAAYRDVEYPAAATVVELDGRLVHDRAVARWADLDRDLESAVSGQVTVRLGWGNVLEPCRTVVGLVRLLRYRGWSGSPRGCSADCPVRATAQVEGDLGLRG